MPLFRQIWPNRGGLAGAAAIWKNVKDRATQILNIRTGVIGPEKVWATKEAGKVMAALFRQRYRAKQPGPAQ